MSGSQLCWELVGCLLPTVMTAGYLGVRSRSPRARGGLVASGRGGFRAGEIGGADCRVTLCGLRSPSVWRAFGAFRPCSRKLIPILRD
jgi:hypothetical protein